MLGGDPSRRGLGAPAVPLGAPRWTERAARFKWTQRDFNQAEDQPASVGLAMAVAQPVSAALSDGVVFTHWSFDILARDLYTGRERWRFRVNTVPRAEKQRTHGAILACPAVAGGIVYAPLQVWPAGDVPRDIMFAGQDIIPPLPVRRLFAVDAGSGKPVWSHEDPRPLGDPFGLAGRLRTLDVTSSPLVMGDAVYAAGAFYSGQFEAWAFAADRLTGAVRWTSRLGYGQQELNLFGRTLKEIPVAAMASDGERLFVQTNMGYVSCLDAATGRPLWTRGYREEEITLYENFWSTPERRCTWSGSPPVLTGGLLLVAPADGRDLLALDAATGALRWAFPSRDGEGFQVPRMYRLLGADDDRAYLAGTGVRALDLRTGKLAWEQSFPGGRFQEESGGRGVIADGKLYVPSTRGVYVMDARDGGSILRSDPHPDAAEDPHARIGGNLVTTEGAAVLVRLEEAEGYFRAEDVRVRAETLLRERPGSLDALMEAARIYLAAERPDDALPLLERALRAVDALPPAERERRRVEVRSNLLGVRERKAKALVLAGDLPAARDAFLTAAALAPDHVSAAALLLRGARAIYAAADAPPDLAASLLEVVVREHGDVVLEDEDHLLDGDPGRSTAASYALWKLSLWRFAQDDGPGSVAALQRIFERPPTDLLLGGSAREVARRELENRVSTYGDKVYAPFEAAAREALESARRSRDPAALAAVAERWPVAHAATEAALEEARLRLESGDAAGVVGAARRILASHPSDDTAATALWFLAEGLLRSGKPAAARVALRRLARAFPEERIRADGAEARAADAVARRLESPDLRAPAEAAALRPGGPLQTLWTRENPPQEPARLLLPRGEPLPGRNLLFLRGPRLEAVDARTGKPAWTTSRPTFRGEVVCAGGYLVFAQEDTALGIDPATGEEAWRQTLPGSAVDLIEAGSLAVVLCTDPADPEDANLVALDPSTGDSAWPQPALVPGGAARLHAMSDAVVLDGSGTTAPVVRVADLQDGRIREFAVPVRRSDDPGPGQVVAARDGPLLLRKDDALEAYEPTDGRPRWTWPADGNVPLHAAAVGDGVAALADGAGVLTALDLLTGQPLWLLGSGPGRLRDPSRTALLADERAVYSVTVDAVSRGGVRLEARDLRKGTSTWNATVSAGPALVEIRPAGDALLVKYLGTAGASRSGVVALDRATGKVIDDFADDRLAGEGFDAAVVAGVLAVANERVVLVRGSPGSGK
jgi:outer membrane protein assembly factor BamB